QKTAREKVEHALVTEHPSVPDVEWLVIDKQPDDLAVGDVHQGLARLRVAISGLRIWQRSQLIEGVEVGARNAVRLSLVQIGSQPEVPVGDGKNGLGLRQDVQVEVRFAQRPWFDCESRVGDHVQSRGPITEAATAVPAACGGADGDKSCGAEASRATGTSCSELSGGPGNIARPM